MSATAGRMSTDRPPLLEATAAALRDYAERRIQIRLFVMRESFSGLERHYGSTAGG
jgi:hypothetical protein